MYVCFICKSFDLPISLASPASKGSESIVSLFFLFGVSAKQLIDEDSTTVSQNDTTGSATFTCTELQSKRFSMPLQMIN